jgi:RNA polymerase sigma-70 factor (ECF subfamily)
MLMEIEKSKEQTEEVLALAISGDSDAFTGIMKSFQKPVLRYLFRLTGNYETAEDLAQDTFIQAYQGIAKLNSGFSFKTWVYRIATNNAYQYLRRKKLYSFILFNDIRRPAVQSREVDAGATFENIALKEALLRVPQDQRVCLILHYIEGFQYREIAQTAGISEDAVRKRVARGIEKLKELFGPNGGEVL